MAKYYYNGTDWVLVQERYRTAGGWSIMQPSSTKVKFAKEVASDMETMLQTANGNSTIKQWWTDHYLRYRTYQPYTGYSGTNYDWFRERAWAYKNLYAIYTSGDDGLVGGGDIVAQQPSWILRDASNNLLYIPFGTPGAFTQFAGDVGNPAFRSNWIARFLEQHPEVRGCAVDDTNHQINTGRLDGTLVNPINPRTGSEYTQTQWENDIATFIEEIAAALPTHEIVPNVVWFHQNGQANSAVQRIIAASDIMHVERGFNDPNLNATTIEWLFQYVDYCHSQNTGCWFDIQTNSDRDWGLASYLLAFEPGLDYVGTSMQYMNSVYNDWWVGPIGDGWDTDLGEPLEPRQKSGSIYTRDFDSGVTVTANAGTRVSTIAPTVPDVPAVGVDFSGTDGYIKYAKGTVFGTSAFTIAALIDRDFAGGSYEALFNFSNSASGGLGGLGFHDDNSVRLDAGGGGSWQTTVQVTAANGWAIVVASLDATGAVRVSRMLLSNSVWTHDTGWANRSALGASDQMFLGSWHGVSNWFDGKVAVAAVWDTVLTDAQRETLDNSLDTDSWLALSPKALWERNLVTDITTHGANQTDSNGVTELTSSGPPGWTFST